ncbi:MAG: hypothetical protein J2P32_11355, partial [Actinobacteria bacterium]|nr:hypothetical protein [Actinomycetota bacterium]
MIGHAPGGKLPSAGPQRPEVTAPAAGSGFRFDGVTVTYRGTVALADFTLEAPAGQVTALLGPSGSG